MVTSRRIAVSPSVISYLPKHTQISVCICPYKRLLFRHEHIPPCKSSKRSNSGRPSLPNWVTFLPAKRLPRRRRIHVSTRVEFTHPNRYDEIDTSVHPKYLPHVRTFPARQKPRPLCSRAQTLPCSACDDLPACAIYAIVASEHPPTYLHAYTPAF